MTKTKNKKLKVSSLQYAFREIIWPRRKLLFLGLFLIVINRLAGLVLPGSTKVLIDDVIPHSDIDLLYKLLIVVFSALLLQGITSFFLTKLLSVEAQYLISKLREKVQGHILHLPMRFFNNSKSGELVSRIMTDVEGVRNLVGTGFVQLIGGLLTSVIAMAILININWKLTVFALIPMLVFSFIAAKAFGFIRPIFVVRGKLNADVTGRLNETLNGIRVIRGFNAESFEKDTFAKGVESLFLNVKKSLTTTALVMASATFLIGLATVIIMGFGGQMIINGEITVGDFVAFTLYLGFMVAPVVQMSNIGSQITEAFAGLDRMEEILSLEREDENESRTISMPECQGNVEFKNVGFAYEEDKEVLDGINLMAKPGSVTALVGSSGSGKSTIAGLVASFYEPSSGEILIDGKNLSEIQIGDYRSQLGVVLQDDFLFEGTIKENVLFSNSNASNSEVNAAVKAAYVDEFADGFELGLETMIGERGVKLSGGQRQRVAIARAILANPKILILDEATSNLDTESESFIQSSLDQLMEGRTTFVIAHRLSTIRKADQILVIEKGQIAESGKHQELLDKKGRYFQLYTYQARI